MSRAAGATLAAAAAAALAAPSAQAKGCLRLLTLPDQPVAGKPVTIRLTSLMAERFTVDVFAPNGRVFRVRLSQTPASYIWNGHFVFRSPGRWKLRVSPASLPGKPRCPPILAVTVRG